LKRLLIFAVCVLLLGVLVSPVNAQPRKHVVERGDTLWDLCEQYYGDVNLWPKLWEMNPFVTNPHLLKPGDVITLLEDVPLKKEPPVTEKAAAEEREGPPAGVDVSRMTNVESMGFLATGELEAAGYIGSGEGDQSMLAEGDTVFVTVNRPCAPGDLFTVYRRSSAVKNPSTGFHMGYIINFLAKVVVRENLSPGSWKGEILESYRTLQVGDPILPHKPISSCVQPLATTSHMDTRIVGVKESHDLIGQYEVVYLGKGYNQGVRRGHIFEVTTYRRLRAGVPPAEVVLGHLLVVESRPDTATGVIMSTDKELFENTAIRGVDWERAQHAFSRLPKCNLE
jgi:LysM repeat protein